MNENQIYLFLFYGIELARMNGQQGWCQEDINIFTMASGEP